MTSTFRTTACALLALTAIALTTVLIRDVRSADDKAAAGPNPIEGAWKHIEQKNGGGAEYTKLPDGQEFINCIAGGRYMWAITKDGKLLTAMGGKYKLDKDKYSETIEWVFGDTIPESFKGSTFDFTAKLEGDTWHKVGTVKVNGQDITIDEKWERCK
jgi:hypothetical protein